MGFGERRASAQVWPAVTDGWSDGRCVNCGCAVVVTKKEGTSMSVTVEKCACGCGRIIKAFSDDYVGLAI